MPMPLWWGRINKRVFNPRAIAGGTWPVLIHVGRRSGATYRTPLEAHPVEGGYLFVLVYGSRSDWVRNVLAADGARRDCSASPNPPDGPDRRLTHAATLRAVGVTSVESYVERPPVPELAGLVRTVWIQRTGAEAYVQRHLPTGGVEVHFPLGGLPHLVGPLTRPEIEVIPAHTTLVGVRFLPGAAPPLPTALDDLVDQRLGLGELWGGSAERLVERVALAGTPERALTIVQAHLVHEFRRAAHVDPLVSEAVRALMPWHPVNIDGLAAHLALSPSQLRRRCLLAVGMTPKVLQRTLRFQGFLALAQAGATATGRRGSDGMAGLAIDVGYADQAHLSRECLRLTGLTPSRLLGGTVDRCACGHDHSASYGPFLATRLNVHDSFKIRLASRS